MDMGSKMGVCTDALDVLCEAMFVSYQNHVKKHYDEPEMRVTFSPDGYNKVRACHDAIFGFLRPLCETDVETVNGYPFSIERDQKEDFIVHIKQVD